MVLFTWWLQIYGLFIKSHKEWTALKNYNRISYGYLKKEATTAALHTLPPPIIRFLEIMAKHLSKNLTKKQYISEFKANNLWIIIKKGIIK